MTQPKGRREHIEAVRQGTFHAPFRQKHFPSMRPLPKSTSVIGAIVLSSASFSFLGAQFAGVAFPTITTLPVKASYDLDLLPVLGAAVAVSACQLATSKFNSLPQINPQANVIPAFAVIVAAVFGAVSLLSGHAYTLFFASCFIGVTCFQCGLARLRARFLKRRVAIVGADAPISGGYQRDLEWLVLSEPRLSAPVSAIVVSRSVELSPEFERLISGAVLQGIPVHDVRHMAEVLTGQVELRHLMENSFGSLIPSLTYVRLKRPLDFVVGLVALILFLPLIIITALLIRLESPGSPIFRQRRMGFRGKPFICYKLRSMQINHAGPFFTRENDVRVTRVGRFIRKTHLDELPQIINIIKGDMSWIGPRPEAVELAELYSQAVAFFEFRHAVRPGITGWAAVHQGNVGDIDAAAVKLRYDFFYIKYCSFWLDSMIILKTIKAVFTGAGAR